MKNSLINWLLLGFLIFGVTPAKSAPLSLSNVPLYLGGSVAPNIMFTLDDSGSMQWEVMPDENLNFSIHLFPRPTGLYGGTDYTNQVPTFADNNVHNYFTRSAANNSIFYNPDIDYIPWSTADGTSMLDADPLAALYNPSNVGLGSLNLTVQQTQNACWFTNTANNLGAAAGNPCFGNHTFWPITYYNYNGGNVVDRNSYTRVQITSTTAAGTTFTSPSGITRTRDEEIQNFANWFQYYRSRILTARAGVGRAFAKQGDGMRVGFSAINEGSRTVDGQTSANTLIRGVRPFIGTNRTNFFDDLYTRVINQSGTPLRRATNSVGEYFERSDDNGPWSANPGSSDSAEHLICRQSFHILTTDGYWNGPAPAGIGNADNLEGDVIEGMNGETFQYSPAPPFADEHSDTLADVAMHYWKRDLRPDLSNGVPTNSDDPAFWQHLVQFTVGLGVNGSLNPDTDFAAISAGTLDWPQPIANSEITIDDLWHAAVNSRGDFFSAADPDTFSDSLADILSNITSRTSSASSVALNSGSISSDSKVFQARFNSGDWTGQLLAFPIDPNNGNLLPVAWDARGLIPAANLRTILTYDGSNGVPFRWAEIDTDQKAQLDNNEAILNYLRGDQSSELSNGGTFRNRNFLLGDIINSAPSFVAAPAQRYFDNGFGAPENTSPYSSFREANKTRTPVVYVGANDGMLHAFNADTGAELFAYVPSAVYDRLADLTNVNYTHKYYVDGSPTVVDAYINGSWRTVLVSGLAAGGQGIFALDVTNPNDFLNEGTAANRVMWEFTDEDDRDLGYTFGQPSIVRLQNGDWAAVFSGGYNNTVDNAVSGDNINDSLTGNAVLYLVNLEDGSLIKKFDTQRGTAQDPTGNNRPNGLASPAAVDVDGDFIVDQIYAGDLFGNMWKIDVSNSDPNDWGFAFGTEANPQPLYTACFGVTCGATNVQPITTRPQVVRHPTGSGILVLFGTGKYFEVGDNNSSGEVTQSLYAIWDRQEAALVPFDRSDLLQQEIIAEVEESGSDYRVTSDTQINWNDKDGWYIDLISPGAASNFGERQVSNTIIRNGKIIFTTLIPSDDPCEFGGTGWLMELDFASGARLEYSPFDVNDDGSFDSADFICIANCELDADGNPDPDRVLVPASGKKSEVGIIPTPSIASEAGGQKEYKYTSGSSGEIEVTVENPGPGFEGRQSWRQLDFNLR